MKPIYILCLHNVRTGGPEAIHQLSDALIEQGFDARMVYYDWSQIAALEQAKPQEAYWFGERENPIEEYARYRVKVSGAAPNEPGNIIVLPETLCHLAPKFDKATVLIWWLSVDNGFGALSKVNLNHLRAQNVRHAYQSAYACKTIEALQLPKAGPLSDYTTDLRDLATPLPWEERGPLALFNANHKVLTDLQFTFDAIAHTDPAITCQALHQMPRASIATLFSFARVYVDLGCFPGKDRLPREAAHMGCNVIVAGAGAGATDYQKALVPKDMTLADRVCQAARSECAWPPIAPPPRFERDQFFNEARSVFSAL